MSNILEQNDARFTISNDGWRRLNAGRKASDLIREAISNTFDADGVTEVRLRLEPGAASIEDNSPSGITNAALVTTVFMTDKEDSPTKRGRKGRGLKELISAAEWAEVDTIGFKTTFTTGRVVETSDRKLGTKVSVKVNAWGQDDIDEAVLYLTKITSPANINFYINDVLVKCKRLRSSFPALLRTQTIVDGVQKDSHETTTIEILNLSKGETLGWIYEMGIPIQKITTRFHVNICQRVPLNDNRDTVDSMYLSLLYGTLLEQMLPNLSATALRHEWVDMGLPYISTDMCKLVVLKLYGKSKIAIQSINARSNDIVKQNGYKLVDTATMSMSLSSAMKAVVEYAEDIVYRIDASVVEEKVPESVAEPTGRLRKLIYFLGRELLNKDIDIEFFKRPPSFTGKVKVAHFKYEIGVIGFNVNNTKFDNILAPDLLSTIVHEFAHNYTDSHDQLFLEKVESLAGCLALLMLTKGDVIKLIADSKPKQMVAINCIRCPAVRYVYPQDVHQVDKCVDCTKKARKERAKSRKIGT